MEEQGFQLGLGDGRSLEVRVAGPAGGTPFVMHHGTPSAGRHFEPFVREATERGLRSVTYSRPGYAGSSRNEGRSVADCAADTAAVLDHLGQDRSYVFGRSGGGPHALACAALLPQRVIACATVAAVAPWGAPGLDFLAGMATENVEEFGAALAGGDELRSFLEIQAKAINAAGPQELAAALGGLVSGVDARALTGDFASFAANMLHDGLRSGNDGWFDDDLAFTRPWGFELSDMTVPVAVWQGGEDLMVPFAHGEWLSSRIPTAHPRLRPEHGHLSLALAAFGELLDDLIAIAEP